MNITINLTDVQVNALVHFAVIRILEDRLEHEVDKEIAKQHGIGKKELADDGDFGHP
jgi:hypothetical protein